MKTKPLSWFLTIFLSIIYFPASIYLIYNRATFGNLKSLSTSAKILKYSGLFNAFIGLSGLFLVQEQLITYLVMLLIGIFMLIKAKTMKENSDYFANYFTLITQNKIYKFNELASIVTGKTPEEVAIDINTMVTIGYFSDFYVEQLSNSNVNFETEPFNIPNQRTNKNCPGCGANLILTSGKISECEYCGTKITA